jgi:hypothetical protein
MWKNDSDISAEAYQRNTGSNDTAVGILIPSNASIEPPSAKTQTVGLDSNLQAEYTLNAVQADLYIYWYEGPTLGLSFVLDTGVGIGNTSHIILG